MSGPLATSPALCTYFSWVELTRVLHKLSRPMWVCVCVCPVVSRKWYFLKIWFWDLIVNVVVLRGGGCFQRWWCCRASTLEELVPFLSVALRQGCCELLGLFFAHMCTFCFSFPSAILLGGSGTMPDVPPNFWLPKSTSFLYITQYQTFCYPNRWWIKTLVLFRSRHKSSVCATTISMASDSQVPGLTFLHSSHGGVFHLPRTTNPFQI